MREKTVIGDSYDEFAQQELWELNKDLITSWKGCGAHPEARINTYTTDASDSGFSYGEEKYS